MIKEYRVNDNVLYAVRVSKRNNFGKKIEKSKSNIKTYSQALKEQKRLSEELIRQIIQEERQGASWGSLIEKWELGLRNNQGLNRPVGRSTAEDYVRALQIYTSHWNKRLAEDITRADVKDVLQEMEELGRSKSRERALINAINSIFRWGADNRLLKGNVPSPAIGIKISREENSKPEILTLSEIKTLLKAAKTIKHPWYAIWAMALHTGCRSGELLALEWADIDFESKRLIVSKTYNRRMKTIKETKGGYWREVPINTELEMLLKELKLQSNGEKTVLPRFIDWERGESARVLRTFCKGIGLPSVRFHALRACFATQLLRSGIAAPIVMKICGWKDLKTMQRYIRLAGVEIEGATDGIRIIPEASAVGELVQLFGAEK